VLTKPDNLTSYRHYGVQAGDDAVDVAFVADWKDHELAFDHRKIVDDACA
jgi:hypothetical protein